VVDTDWQRLISEYCANEKMDQIFRDAAPENETESIGLKSRRNEAAGRFLWNVPRGLSSPKILMKTHFRAITGCDI